MANEHETSERQRLRPSPMSSKDHKHKLDNLVSAWIGPWKAVGPQRVIAMIVHEGDNEYTVDILHGNGVTSVWRVNLKDL